MSENLPLSESRLAKITSSWSFIKLAKQCGREQKLNKTAKQRWRSITFVRYEIVMSGNHWWIEMFTCRVMVNSEKYNICHNKNNKLITKMGASRVKITEPSRETHGLYRRVWRSLIFPPFFGIPRYGKNVSWLSGLGRPHINISSPCRLKVTGQNTMPRV